MTLPFCVQVVAFRDVSLKSCPSAGSSVVFVSPHRLHVSVTLPFCVQVAAFRNVSLKWWAVL